MATMEDSATGKDVTMTRMFRERALRMSVVISARALESAVVTAPTSSVSEAPS